MWHEILSKKKGEYWEIFQIELPRLAGQLERNEEVWQRRFEVVFCHKNHLATWRQSQHFSK